MELTIVLAAVVIGSISKSVTGMGLPLIVIPIAALFVDLDDAVVVIALPNLLANGVLATRERSHLGATRDLPALLVFGGLGAAIGTVAFINVSETPLAIALIIATMAYITTFFAKPDLQVTPERSRRLAPAVGTLAGAFQGAIGISGPIVGSWIHSYRLPRGAHIVSVTVLFFVAGAVQFAILLGNGDLGGRMIATLLACVPVLATIPLGTRLRDRLSGRSFDLAVVGMLGVASIALCIRTIGSIL